MHVQSLLPWRIGGAPPEFTFQDPLNNEGGLHESPELAHELDFKKVLTMDFEAGAKLKLRSDRGPEFTTLEGWGCTARVYYPGGLGLHLQSLLPCRIEGAPPEFSTLQNWGCTARVCLTRFRVYLFNRISRASQRGLHFNASWKWPKRAGGGVLKPPKSRHSHGCGQDVTCSC